MRGGSHAGEPDVRSAEGGATAPEALSAAAGPVVNRPSRSATGGATGSRLTLLHAERMMTVYPIVEIGTDHDYDHERPLCGMLFCERFVHWVRSHIWISSVYYPELPAEAKAMLHYGAPICALLGALSLVLGTAAVWFRRSTWRAVKQSATTATSPRQGSMTDGRRNGVRRRP